MAENDANGSAAGADATERVWFVTGAPDLTLRYTRVALNQRMRRRVEEGLGYGLALEGLSVISAFTEDPERADRSSATGSS
jgi:hypothetical protein